MFIPYSTDAPVYHWPFATVGLIVVNVAVFAAMLASSPADALFWEAAVLVHGEGLQPLQWLTRNFIHGGFGHLIGNMLFLWVFGLVVEGKLGWQRFLACYLGIGLTQSGLEQILFLGYSGNPSFSYGASAIIYGVMAMAAVWAPKNDIQFLYWIAIFVGTIDVPIGLLCAIYVGLDLFGGLLAGMRGLSSWLHLMGAAMGLPLGILLLKRKIVDCEGWDLFHVWSGNYGSFAEPERPSAEEESLKQLQLAEKQTQKLKAARELLHQQLTAGQSEAALTLYHNMQSVGEGLVLTRDELLALIRGLHKSQKWAASAPLMAEVLARFPEGSDLVRLRLAHICVAELARPGRALDLLEQLKVSQLSAENQSLARKIARKAQELQAAGTVEIDDEKW